MFFSLNYFCYNLPSRIKKHIFSCFLSVVFYCHAICLSGLILSFFWITPLEAFQSSETHDQLKVKAAFILNLARFVEWPDDLANTKKQNVVLCFYQYNFLGQSTDTIRNKKIHNKTISIKIIKNLKINQRCEVVLIAASSLLVFLEHNDLENLQKRVTITDLSSETAPVSSLENKVIFRLKRDQSRLRFEVNNKAAKSMGVTIGSELLKLGILVTDPERVKPNKNHFLDFLEGVYE